MNRTDKAAAVELLHELFTTSESLLLADASGIDVNTINELRSKFRAEGVTFRVVKNTLARRALEGTDKSELKDKFKGPTAVAAKAGDPVTPAKIAVAFAKDNGAFDIKAGYIPGELLDVEGIVQLSKMKDKDELRAELLSLFKAPQTQFVGVANTMVTQIVSLLSARARDLEG